MLYPYAWLFTQSNQVGVVLVLFLLNATFAEYINLLAHVLLISTIWIFFIKTTAFDVRVAPAKTDKVRDTVLLQKSHSNVYLNYFSCSLLVFLSVMWVLSNYEVTYLWSQLCVGQSTHLFVLSLTIICFTLLRFYANLTNNNANRSGDFYFALINIIAFLYYIFYTATLYGLIFILELNAVFIFYKFIASSYWYRQSRAHSLSSVKDARPVATQYAGMLFFQYWATFFSSILLFFALANIYLIYSTADYLSLDLLTSINTYMHYLDNPQYLMFIWFPIIMGFFIKIGLSPFHLFKVEVYQGLSFAALVFYTTFYFFAYMIFFSILMSAYMYSVKLLVNNVIYIILTAGTIYISTTLFDLTTIKAFFAYSTIVNTLLFLTALVFL